MNDVSCNIKSITSNLTSFSHAYLFDVDSLENAMPFVLNFAKKILCSSNYVENCNNSDCNICYLIDQNQFDDLYILNPDTISINSGEIDNLMTYFKTKSLRLNGKRLYIVYGFERLNSNISNKILKFLEEPENDIYAILMTENVDKILPTIVSRCQIIRMHFESTNYDIEIVNNMKNFVSKLLNTGVRTIAYVLDYWQDSLSDRVKFINNFIVLEKILSFELNRRYGLEGDNAYNTEILSKYSNTKILDMLSTTICLKNLIAKNINLNLLLDRYIIEITKE